MTSEIFSHHIILPPSQQHFLSPICEIIHKLFQSQLNIYLYYPNYLHQIIIKYFYFLPKYDYLNFLNHYFYILVSHKRKIKLYIYHTQCIILEVQ